MVRIGDVPRPRGLVCLPGYEDAERVMNLFPTGKVVGSLTEVDQRDYDVLVTSQSVNDTHPLTGETTEHVWSHINVVTFSAFGLPMAVEEGHEAELTLLLVRRAESKSRVLEVPDPIAGSLLRDAAVSLATEANRRVEELGASYSVLEFQRDSTPLGLRPFATDEHGRIVGGEYRRQQGTCWSLPSWADPVTWTQLALREWAEANDDWFPKESHWRSEPRWWTAREAAASDEIARRAGEFEAIKSDYEEAATRLAGELDAAQSEAELTFHRLLSEQGDDLKDTVADCLSHLGFEVHDMDEVHEPGSLREDLRVRDPSDPTWEAMVEVRSYPGGGKENELLRILGKQLPAYAAEKGQNPDGIWWVANTFKGRSPDEREPLLASSPDSLVEFAEAGGLAIDTAELLALLLAVDRAEIDKGDARRLLRESVGRFESPS